MATVGVFAPVSVVFPGTPADDVTFRLLLGSLSRTDVLFWCACLNHVLTSPSDLTHAQRQHFGVRQFLVSDEVLRIERFVREHGGPDAVTAFFRGQLLEILRWAVLLCQDHPADGTTFENPEVRRTFAKAALIASDIWARRVFGAALTLDGGVAAARQRSIGPLRKGIEGGLLAPEMAHVVGRGWRLFHDLVPSVAPSFSGRFQSATGMTVEEYYVCWCAVVTHFMKPKSDAAIFDAHTLGTATQDRPLVQRFVALESQTAEELRRALWGTAELGELLPGQLPVYDYKPMREKPLLRAADGRTIIIDPIFMADKAAAGPLFHVLRVSNASEANDAFAALGEAFERYVQDFLRRAFPRPGAALFHPLAFKLKGRSSSKGQFEVDACLNYITDLVLFEIKAVWLREAQFLPENAQTLLVSLRDKYVESEAGKKKGVGQLARVSHAVSTGEWLGDQNQFSQVKRVWPVLVVHDSLLSAPGFGTFVAGQFDQDIGLGETPGTGQRHSTQAQVIAPIVMTVADLEMLEVSLEHFGLLQVLRDYSDTHPDRMTSFHDFLASSHEYSRRIYVNRHLASVALQPLKAAMRRLFGQCVD